MNLKTLPTPQTTHEADKRIHYEFKKRRTQPRRTGTKGPQPASEYRPYACAKHIFHNQSIIHIYICMLSKIIAHVESGQKTKQTKRTEPVSSR